MITALRGVIGKAMTPLARALLRIGVSPDAVTIIGTIGTIAAALWLLPTGHLFVGALVIGAFALSDALDGTMARLSGRSGPWGAFLDSTLDRLADGAIFTAIGVYFLVQQEGNIAIVGASLAAACVVFGFTVSYARARAEGLGFQAAVGIAERSERLVISLVVTGFVGIGLPVSVLVVVLGIIAVASLITVGQRMAAVRSQAKAADADTP
ncbi:CDP-alcohol phosphatidyltransferase family protein [Rarobacter faecitabidus]|uniref:Phosphatidylinositol phosphate synthase n=1 Tax=Rarobacter faecitabidus TaxID=13243 RepID=A0A542ZV50_RARFA|nr:CDP-alcohol phosphatidyltransferase family protein [Rarobacter faecitabidus]TQL64233.1 CDP-diacylglycerol inositol 3-phosphatidyltransferase [Rarobacter faecitabidus]